ncbi:armadillo-type protein [Mycena latifolia]|nr:armadillo-type protein [Mycena latifolia]
MHHPLTRQPTPDSLHSWWSDRNPLGPNINLHAAAKPLMRFMYRRDALAFIAKTRGIPLSSKDMEIYSSYLAYKYVSSSTKTSILKELQTRVESKNDACAVADSFLLHLVDEFLSSPDPEIRRPMCRILAVLARRETTVPAVLRREPCPQLVSLLHDRDNEVISSAAQTLYGLAKWPEGAQAAVDANVLGCLAELLESPHDQFRKWPCDMLAELARQETTARAVIGALLSLLRRGNLIVIRRAAKILERVATSPDGAQAAADANMGVCISELLESPNILARRWTCTMLEEMAGGANLTLGSLCLQCCPQLISLLRDQDFEVILMASKALCRMASSAHGAQAVVDANVLDFMPKLIDSPSAGVRKWAWVILEELLRHDITARAAVGNMVYILRSGSIAGLQNAAQILSHKIKSPEGAQAALDADILECVLQLIGSPGSEVRQRTWDILEELAHHESTAGPALGQVIFLLRNPTVPPKRAMDILNNTITSPQGAQTLVYARILECVPGLVELRSAGVRRWTWDTLKVLAHHETTARPAMGAVLSLLRSGNPSVIQNAAQILYQTTRSPGGVQAAVDANLLECVPSLVQSTNAVVRRWTWDTLEMLARNKITAVPAMEQVVFLLRNGDPGAILSAVQILYQMTKTSEGAQAAVDANALACVPGLVESPNALIHAWVWDALEDMLYHDTTASRALRQVISLFCDSNSTVHKRAAAVLSDFIVSPRGSQILMNPNMRDCATILLELPNAESPTWEWRWKMLAKLSLETPTDPALLYQLVLLLRHENSVDVVSGAAKILYWIATSPAGAQAIVDANALAYVETLLKSQDTAVKIWTCELLAKLAGHTSSGDPGWQARLCRQLVYLLRWVKLNDS